MKRILLILIPVIILVSINWFSNINASELSSLTAEEKARLLEQFEKNSSTRDRVIPANDHRYQTPQIYDESEGLISPARSTTDNPDGFTGEISISNQVDGLQPNLIPFDQLDYFGHDLFQSADGEVLPPDDIASSNDYILGPGDNVIIYLWGRVEKEYQLTLDREGKIIVPKVGQISVWGMSLGKFKETARKKFATVYSDFDLAVSLGRIRSIRVYLTGEVNRPGAYTVSSLTSLFNALYLAGGPSDIGSMRAIRLMRSGKTVAEVDLYRFLLAGDNSIDITLKSGDAIFVPVAGNRVGIRGQIRRPAIYELLGQETVRDLLELAGRPTANAYLDRVMLERVADRNEWEVIDMNLTEPTSPEHDNLVLLDGDRVTVFSIFDAKKNMVAIYGQVQHPGLYERNDSTRISSLIERAGLQPYDVYYQRANLFRRHSDWNTEIIAIDLSKALDNDPANDLILSDKDSLHIYSQEDIRWDQYAYIDGEVKNPGQYPLYQGMSVQDLIFLAGSFTRSASILRVELARVSLGGQVTLVPIDLTIQEDRNYEIAEGDRLYIRQIPQWRLHRTVKLTGAVNFPGEYVLASEDETLYQLIQRAGGLVQNAFPKGLILERGTIDSSLTRLRIPQQLKNSTALRRDTLGNIIQEDYFAYESELVNRIILDIDQIFTSRGKTGDVVLEPGDKISIPTIPTGITVMGAVGSTGTTKFKERKNVKFYIKRVGNFTPRADKKGTRLIRASGEVYSGGSVLSQRVQLGDVIVVPTKIKTERKSFIQSLATVLTASTGILTTILLIDRL